MKDSRKSCPCHSQKSYDECCRRYHEGEAAESALILMRSRYSAYALQLADYIIKTTHNQNRHQNSDLNRWKNEILSFSKTVQFKGLQIIDFQEKSDTATVTFRAILKQNHQDVSFTEKSLFIKINGRWYFQEPKR